MWKQHVRRFFFFEDKVHSEKSIPSTWLAIVKESSVVGKQLYWDANKTFFKKRRRMSKNEDGRVLVLTTLSNFEVNLYMSVISEINFHFIAGANFRFRHWNGSSSSISSPRIQFRSRYWNINSSSSLIEGSLLVMKWNIIFQFSSWIETSLHGDTNYVGYPREARD